MIVMPSNNAGIVVGWLVGRFPKRLGHLFSPAGLGRTYDFMPFALDNGRFPCWINNTEWDPGAYLGMLDRVAEGRHKPMWILVPDIVADRDGTLREWDHWCHRLASDYHWPLAFAAQDGMTPDDVPNEAEVVFVGGSTEWKRKTMHDWCSSFDRVHIGRINTNRWLWECDEAGAESCDGTGWFRGKNADLSGLISYLERSSQNKGNPRGQRLFT